MKRFGRVVIETCGAGILRAAGLMGIAVAVAFVLAIGAAHAQCGSTVTNPPAYEFDVVTIKPSRPTPDGGVVGFIGDNTFWVKNSTTMGIIRFAFGFRGNVDGLISGAPQWLDSDKYDIMAKTDNAMADKLKALRPDQREMAKERMIQALLADRFKLAIHREAKEFPIYALTIAKSGLKLHEAKPGDTYAKAFPYANNFDGGAEPAGRIFGVPGADASGNTMTIYGFGISMSDLARDLTNKTGQTVQDKTGLTGRYDVTLKYWITLLRSGSDGAPDVQSAAASEPTGGTGLMTAIQQQLGLKLESTKGPVSTVVIDHVERPSGN